MGKRWLRFVVLAVLSLGLFGTATAATQWLKPFVLASVSAGTLKDKVGEVRKKLEGAGFDVVGDYVPYEGTDILVVTSKALKDAAAKEPGAGYAVAQRVAVTQVGDKLQVSFTNPVYMANAYQMSDDLSDVRAKLAGALGDMQDFGANRGIRARKLRRYHYTFGMEYYGDPYELASYGSHDEAVRAVEAGLAAHKGGVVKVARIDIPGTDQTYFAVGFESTKDPDANDKHIMSIIDFHSVKSSAYLPYEMMVNGRKVVALHARFRIAICFPDLSMMGEKSFMRIMGSPSAMGAALAEAAGGDPDKFR